MKFSAMTHFNPFNRTHD